MKNSLNFVSTCLRVVDMRRYTGDDWTSVTQIGQSFGGVTLTEREYKRVEHAYVNAALVFLSEGGLTAMKVEGLENPRRRLLTFMKGICSRVNG